MWWKKKEQPLRTALFYNTFAGIFGGILSFALGHINGSLAKWKVSVPTFESLGSPSLTRYSLVQYLFLVYGSVTVAFGLLVTAILPSSPETAWFLTPRERIRAVARLAENQQNVQVKLFRPAQCLEAIKDLRYWILILFTIAQSITNAGITNFNPLIINGLHFSASRTTVSHGGPDRVTLVADAHHACAQLMATPQAAVALIAQVSFSAIAYWVPNIRCFLWMLSCLPAIAGCVIIHVVDHVKYRGVALAGIYMLGFYNVSWVS